MRSASTCMCPHMLLLAPHVFPCLLLLLPLLERPLGYASIVIAAMRACALGVRSRGMPP